MSSAAVAAAAAAEEEALRKRKVLYLIIKRLNKKKRGIKEVTLPTMIKELIGKNVKITTLSAVHRGKVVDIQDNWIKIILKNGKEYFVKEDMLTGISTL